ncbi:hypothetical protein BH10PLA2_BH10PLA2_28410 [soil metagenome]
MYFVFNQGVCQTNGKQVPKLRARSRRMAAAAVEMALISPFLFAVLLGTIEFGRAIMVSNTLTSTAREGVRAAVVPGGSSSDASTLINSNLNSMGIASANATITVKVNGVVANASTATSGDDIDIKISVPYSKVTWIPTNIFMKSTATLAGQAVMRRE